ncbi:conjugal transfer protein [Streptomyces lavendulae]|uniref:conjugal transfer protein n=1 Tax=Streptomyces lavendulae TaxID=1914 RepID=UPI0031F04FC2
MVAAESAAPEEAGRNPGPEGPGAPWAVVPESSQGLARAGQLALWGTAGAVCLLALVGARSLFATDPAPAPQAAPASGPSTSAYPEDAARAVAVRAVRAYLTWDEKQPAGRARELAGLLAVGLDPQLGWDGRGAQTAGAVVPGAVTAGTGGRARVRVEAEVMTGAGPARWLALDVPVLVGGGGRLVVSGAPALLGVPDGAAAAPEPTPRPADLAFSTQTRAAVTDFYKAWASGGGTQVTAPGTVLPALPDGVELRTVQSWEAAPGTGADRSGVARVVWAVGGGEITQAYRVTLTRVESVRAGRWQVSGVTGDDLS